MIGLIAFIVLWLRYGGAGPGVELDVIRTVGGIMIAAGGALTLLLAARRQAHTERDSGEQRITELYTRAVDQLGAEKAPVRLGGLHALERVAQNNPAQRQTIVDVICAYLRMPFTPPDDQAPGEDASEDTHSRYEQRRQELQVRLTAQRILSAHLEPGAAAVFWDGIDLNLIEAHLHQFDLTACHIRRADFDRATFTGDTWFSEAKFAGDAVFGAAKFAGDAEFSGSEFSGFAVFGETKFGRTEFGGDTWFSGAKFIGRALFGGAVFSGDTGFNGAKFVGGTGFGGAEFAENTTFDGARVASKTDHFTLPMGWITRAAQPANGEEEGWLYVVRDEDSSAWPAEATDDGEGQS